MVVVRLCLLWRQKQRQSLLLDLRGLCELHAVDTLQQVGVTGVSKSSTMSSLQGKLLKGTGRVERRIGISLLVGKLHLDLEVVTDEASRPVVVLGLGVAVGGRGGVSPSWSQFCQCRHNSPSSAPFILSLGVSSFFSPEEADEDERSALAPARALPSSGFDLLTLGRCFSDDGPLGSVSSLSLVARSPMREARD